MWQVFSHSQSRFFWHPFSSSCIQVLVCTVSPNHEIAGLWRDCVNNMRTQFEGWGKREKKNNKNLSYGEVPSPQIKLEACLFCFLLPLWRWLGDVLPVGQRLFPVHLIPSYVMNNHKNRRSNVLLSNAHWRYYTWKLESSSLQSKSCKRRWWWWRESLIPLLGLRHLQVSIWIHLC